jgi:hypothetical protein
VLFALFGEVGSLPAFELPRLVLFLLKCSVSSYFICKLLRGYLSFLNGGSKVMVDVNRIIYYYKSWPFGFSNGC